MNRISLTVLILFAIFSFSFITGCVGGPSQKSQYYVFHSTVEAPISEKANLKNNVGVGPIRLPEYLKRPQIVRQQKENVLEINEFHRWGDSLEAQITSILAENLSKLLNTPHVVAYPWERPFSPQYQIYVHFNHFEESAAGTALVEAVWRVVDTRNEKSVLTKKSAFSEPTGTIDYTTYVKVLNLALEKLSNEIANGILDIME